MVVASDTNSNRSGAHGNHAPKAEMNGDVASDEIYDRQVDLSSRQRKPSAFIPVGWRGCLNHRQSVDTLPVRKWGAAIVATAAAPENRWRSRRSRIFICKLRRAFEIICFMKRLAMWKEFNMTVAVTAPWSDQLSGRYRGDAQFDCHNDVFRQVNRRATRQYVLKMQMKFGWRRLRPFDYEIGWVSDRNYWPAKVKCRFGYLLSLRDMKIVTKQSWQSSRQYQEVPTTNDDEKLNYWCSRKTRDSATVNN